MQGRGEGPALIYDSPLARQKRTLTYRALQVETQLLAGILRNFGVEKGDRVVLYMPMVPEAAIAMLACARLGAVHSVVFGGFAANELATRIDDAKPKVILSASCGLEPGRIGTSPLLDEAIQLSTRKPVACLILQRPQEAAALVAGRDHDWAEVRDEAIVFERGVHCVPVVATDPLYILYTSGTTGRPKGVVRDNGGHLVALKWSMRNLYGVEPGEVFWTASDVGRVVGHSYLSTSTRRCSMAAPRSCTKGTRGHARRWRVLARDRRAPMRRDVHGAARAPRDQEGGPAREILGAKRSQGIPHAAGRRARRSRHRRLGVKSAAEETGDRPLVADRDRMGNRRQSGGPRAIAGETRLDGAADARL
jgi:propionyl-CoA synthetase